jgi:hypothetical protein
LNEAWVRSEILFSGFRLGEGVLVSLGSVPLPAWLFGDFHQACVKLRSASTLFLCDRESADLNLRFDQPVKQGSSNSN